MFFSRGKVKCRKVQNLISEYLDEQIDEGLRNEIESHLNICEDCAAELESMRTTIGLLKSTPSVRPRRSFTVREADVMPERARQPRSMGWLRPVHAFTRSGARAGASVIAEPKQLRWLRPATAVVAVALVLLLMLDFMQVIPGESKTATDEMFNTPPAAMLAESDSATEKAFDGASGFEQAPPVPMPAPLPSATDIDGEPWLQGGYGLEDEIEPGMTRSIEEVDYTADSEKDWPLLEIEIAVGILFVVMIGIILYSGWWRRRSALS